MRLCCMMNCAPGKSAGDVGYPMVPSSNVNVKTCGTDADDVGYPMVPSSTKPCGAKIMPTTPCQKKTMEKKVRKGSECEQKDGNVGGRW